MGVKLFEREAWLRVLVNRVLRKVSGNKRDKVTEVEKTT
jgi:hypothetical protein